MRVGVLTEKQGALPRTNNPRCIYAVQSGPLLNWISLEVPPFPGAHSRATSPDEPTVVPPCRITSEGPEDATSSADVPVRSPVLCVSPEFVNAIAMNPGGRPKEVQTLAVFVDIHELRFSWHGLSTNRGEKAFLESLSRSFSGRLNMTQKAPVFAI